MTATHEQIDAIIRLALAEDAPWGDLTCEAFVPVDAQATAQMVAREPGVLSGIDVFGRVFALVNGDDAGGPLAPVTFTAHLHNGARFEAGQALATVTGPAHTVLRGERIALNLTQRMCGVATMTATYAAAIAGAVSAKGAPVRIVDTRKTTPGLRALEKQAVRDGGGHNHRYSLSDAVMAKDNHLAVLVQQGMTVGDAIRAARARLPHTTSIEVEVDRLDQIEEVVAAGVDTIMLDNFTPDQLREGVALVAGRAWIEASGGITLATIADVAQTGIDIISVGALTHSVRNLDLGLDINVTT
ncbi:MAG: carboxylating nicotinate-nucleotide diphosphorylase [Cellulomonadaceae bacterium]|jgi:nicotinate-nucleotide pyrophosphorylase (carboxylating)|nr:carboxylating nicotinate-nucleotide diphosphorylase [Cellulomonadaceae bacterium]